jgi:hypothetical protein
VPPAGLPPMRELRRVSKKLTLRPRG